MVYGICCVVSGVPHPFDIEIETEIPCLQLHFLW